MDNSDEEQDIGCGEWWDEVPKFPFSKMSLDFPIWIAQSLLQLRFRSNDNFANSNSKLIVDFVNGTLNDALHNTYIVWTSFDCAIICVVTAFHTKISNTMRHILFERSKKKRKYRGRIMHETLTNRLYIECVAWLIYII